jgi:hypothetical protein
LELEKGERRGEHTMARIKIIEPKEANEQVKAVYKDMERVRGKGNIGMQYKAYANLPDVLTAHWEKTKRLTYSDSVPLKIKEATAVIVSVALGCEP